METFQERQWNRYRNRKRTYARMQRLAPTRTESILWQALRNRQLCGCKFRRQEAMGPYIVDFRCCSHRLIIEVDGSVHASKIDYDRERDLYFKDRQYRVLRVMADDVENRLDDVLLTIKNTLLQ